MRTARVILSLFCLLFLPLPAFPLKDYLLVKVRLNLFACFFIECLQERWYGNDVVCHICHIILYGVKGYFF